MSTWRRHEEGIHVRTIEIWSYVSLAIHNVHCRKIRASKLAAIWSNTPAVALLFHVGFRPVIMKAPPAAAAAGGSDVDDVFLVLEAGEDAVKRASTACNALSNT